MANAEFLSESNRNQLERADIYQEVRSAVNQMTELIDSLLEFSRTRDALHSTHGSLEDVIARAVHVVSAHPEFHPIAISIHSSGTTDGWFDARKMERVFQNLVRNACEAVSADRGKIEINLVGEDDRFLVTVEEMAVAFQNWFAVDCRTIRESGQGKRNGAWTDDRPKVTAGS